MGEQDVLSWCIVYCSKLYSHKSYCDSAILSAIRPQEDLKTILREKDEIAVAALERRSLLKLIAYQPNLFKIVMRPLLIVYQRSVIRSEEQENDISHDRSR